MSRKYNMAAICSIIIYGSVGVANMLRNDSLIMKKEVQYIGSPIVVVGYPATVYPINHTSVLVSNNQAVLTSCVISSDPDTGRFETMNSVYVKSAIQQLLSDIAEPQLCDRHKSQLIMQWVFNTANNCDFVTIDLLLSTIDLNTIELRPLIGLIRSTGVYRTKLSNWAKAVQLCHDRCIALGKDNTKILIGLPPHIVIE